MIQTQTMHNRRFLKTRKAKWAHALAQRLQKIGVTPNQVSMLSVAFAVLAGVLLIAANNITGVPLKNVFYGLTALFIQLRLLCNLIDGMLAVECGLKTKSGEIFNDLPDRVSDTVILVCAGYSISGSIPMGATLGWAAALLAVFTAYIRVLGVSLDTTAFFGGPMAKPHRMFTLTVGCLMAMIFTAQGFDTFILCAALMCIILGSLVTCLRRITFIVEEVRTQ